MSDKSAIEWTDATWNPVTGCTKVSPGCISLFENTRIDTGTLVDWVIVGGESGRGARPMQTSWARHLRDECTRHDIPFLFKQWGEWGPTVPIDDPLSEQIEPGMQRVGKNAAGRELDGRTWDQYPAATA